MPSEKKEGGMNPMIGSALIGLGGSLLGGIFGGKGKAQDRRADLKAQKELMRYSDSLKAGRAQEWKPSTPRYETYGNLNDFDQVIKTYMGNLLGQWGGGGKGNPGLANFDPSQLWRSFSDQSRMSTPGNLPSSPMGGGVDRKKGYSGGSSKRTERATEYDPSYGSDRGGYAN